MARGHTGRRRSCAWRALGDVVPTPVGVGVAPQLVAGAAPYSLVASVSFFSLGEGGRSCRAGLGFIWALGSGAGIWELRGRAGAGVLSWGCERAFLRKLYEPQLS